ncbi:hypothetical protein [Bradyrhizobium sp. 25ACV]
MQQPYACGRAIARTNAPAPACGVGAGGVATNVLAIVLQPAHASHCGEAAVKARHLLNLYAASLPVEDTRHRALVAALFDDFVRLSGEG